MSLAHTLILLHAIIALCYVVVVGWMAVDTLRRRKQ